MTPRRQFGATSAATKGGASSPRFVGLASRTQSWACPSPSEFAILVMYARDDVHLQLTGELNGDGAEAFTACVATALHKEPRKLVVDLSGLGSIDQCGVD